MRRRGGGLVEEIRGFCEQPLQVMRRVCAGEIGESRGDCLATQEMGSRGLTRVHSLTLATLPLNSTKGFPW